MQETLLHVDAEVRLKNDKKWYLSRIYCRVHNVHPAFECCLLSVKKHCVSELIKLDRDK